MLVLNPVVGNRIVSTPQVLDEAVWSTDALAFRTAPDELFVMPEQETRLNDPHAIIIRETSYMAGWVDESVALHFLAHSCEWVLPLERPAFAQGAVAGMPVKMYFTDGQILFLVEAAFAEDFMELWR